MEAGSLTTPRAVARTLSVGLSVPLALGLLVAASAIVRFLLALAHPTPLLFADEYIYSTLAHELATTGRPTIRGESASFPALLQPILTAPFWLFGDAGIALRLTQALNAAAMSAAAVPVYLLARKIGVGVRFALGGAAFAVVCPGLFYVAYVLAEPIAYPLVLAAVLAGVSALVEPTRRNQILFVLCAGLAASARIQFVVLPLAFVVAALVARTPVRKLRLSFALFGVGAAAAAVRGLGYYSGVREFSVDVGGIAHWLAVDAFLLALAAGVVVVPGALVTLALPRTHVERAFAAFTVSLAALLFVQAALFATNTEFAAGGRFQERYLMTLAPLLAIAFCASVRRGGRTRFVVAGVGALLLVLSARFPLTAWTDPFGRQDSPFLIGARRLELALTEANAALLVAVAIAALAGAAVVAAFRPRLAPYALGASCVFLGAVGASAWALDATESRGIRKTYFPADARWIDASGVGPVTAAKTPGSPRELVLEQMFWNRSVERLVRLGAGDAPDAFEAPFLRVRDDGVLLVEGEPLTGALLVDGYGVDARLSDATKVAATRHFALWRPDGSARLRLFAGGRFFDGWLARTGYVRTWGAAATLRLRLSLPRGFAAAAVAFRTPEGLRRVRVRPGSTRLVAFPVPAGKWKLEWEAPATYLPDGRPVGVRADRLELVGR